MANELNELVYNNTPITFTGKTDNIATSDELQAPLLYQDKMGTAYSRSKAVSRAINLVGISLILTATAAKTGSLISNAFILNRPTVSATTYDVSDHTFNASFTISNPNNYQMFYYLFLNENKEPTLVDECKEEKEYLVSYEGLSKGDSGLFYIRFSNSFDYEETIESYTFIVEE